MSKILSLQDCPSPVWMCRQEVADALDEVALASQQCSLLSQQHQAKLPNPEPVVDQVRVHYICVTTNDICLTLTVTGMSA